MSNKPEINPDGADSDASPLAMLQVVQTHQALVKANRILLGLVFILMLAVFILGLIVVPKPSFTAKADVGQIEQAAYALQNPAISAEINALKAQMFGLVSGSIESKLRSLEDSIKRGSMTDSLNTLQDLKSDVKVLNGYAPNSQAKSADSGVNQQLIKEVTDLKDFVYLTFISCGLMLAGVAGIWLRYRYRLTHQSGYAVLLEREKRQP